MNQKKTLIIFLLNKNVLRQQRMIQFSFTRSFTESLEKVQYLTLGDLILVSTLLWQKKSCDMLGLVFLVC